MVAPSTACALCLAGEKVTAGFDCRAFHAEGAMFSGRSWDSRRGVGQAQGSEGPRWPYGVDGWEMRPDLEALGTSQVLALRCRRALAQPRSRVRRGQITTQRMRGFEIVICHRRSSLAGRGVCISMVGSVGTSPTQIQHPGVGTGQSSCPCPTRARR